MQEADAQTVLGSYGFEFDRSRLGLVLADWEVEFGREWILLGIVESVHQGRYKLASVGQILRCWQRRGQPRLSFDREFQRMVLKEVWQPIVAPVHDEPPEEVRTLNLPVPAARSERKLRALAGLRAV
ncbi:hypothetical protein [Gloeobacter kilaueensis]|uniref:hypothetical protein n=1 Tax=Gloeobacter kilaueensis TaxID=1416614 RepID=UPI00165169F1|nr:hypothetical protein [Gloeobacter kilaueensis]